MSKQTFWQEHADRLKAEWSTLDAIEMASLFISGMAQVFEDCECQNDYRAFAAKMQEFVNAKAGAMSGHHRSM